MKNGKNAAHGGAKRSLVLVVSVLVLLLAVAGGTLAWLVANSGPVTNTFIPAHVTCTVEETFNSTTGVKTNVNVKNTSDIDVYIRVKLVTYRTNDAGQHIGGTATIPTFTPGTGWVFHDGYYYYTLPVVPNGITANLISSITLASYTDADGGHQAIDVMAEAIQSGPAEAVQAAWGTGFGINTDGSLIVPNN